MAELQQEVQGVEEGAPCTPQWGWGLAAVRLTEPETGSALGYACHMAAVHAVLHWQRKAQVRF